MFCFNGKLLCAAVIATNYCTGWEHGCGRCEDRRGCCCGWCQGSCHVVPSAWAALLMGCPVWRWCRWLWLKFCRWRCRWCSSWSRTTRSLSRRHQSARASCSSSRRCLQGQFLRVLLFKFIHISFSHDISGLLLIVRGFFQGTH